MSGANPGFAFPDSQGVMRGSEADDFWRAVAAATLGDAGRVKRVILTATNRFTALQSGEAELLDRAATWTLAGGGADSGTAARCRKEVQQRAGGRMDSRRVTPCLIHDGAQPGTQVPDPVRFGLQDAKGEVHPGSPLDGMAHRRCNPDRPGLA